MEEQCHDVGPITMDQARAELERLLSDSRFHVTDRAVSILRYLADHLFQGQQDGVKAYAIAVDVLGRPSSFDPAIDPIVRIEVSRLRSALNQYYEAYGAETTVELQLPKGKYLAVFLRSGVTPRQVPDDNTRVIVEMPPPLLQPAAAEEPAVAMAAPNLRRINRWKLSLAAALAAVVVAAATVGLFLYGLRPQYTQKPTVSVTMTAPDARWAGDASLTRDMLLTALAQFQTLRLATATTGTRRLADSLREPKDSAYEIAMKYYGDGDDRSVWWQIVDTRSGDLLSSGVEHIDTKGKAEATVRNELVTTLSRRFATARGAINNIETHNGAANSLGNACVLRAEYALDDGGPDAIAEAGACLEKTLAADPSNADASATLSRVLISEQSGGANAVLSGRSVNLANRSVSLAPLSDRAQIALMLAQLDSGRTDAAISAGNRALLLNPNNPEVSAKLALVLFTLGYWDAGVSLAQDAGRSVDAVPRDAILVLALDAYRRGDWAETSLLSEQVTSSDFIIRVLRAAALGQLGSDQAAGRLDEAGRGAPEFETTFNKEMERRHFNQALSASLKEGLVKAGLKSGALASAF
jgi:tetratricopeptide (TPR) repeat protein